jgi:hypothetical protein
MEQAILVPVEAAVDNTLRNTLIIAGSVVLVGACAAAAYMYANRDRNSELTKVENLLASTMLADLAEITEARNAAAKKAMSGALAEARKAHPHPLLDNPVETIAAFREVRKN